MDETDELEYLKRQVTNAPGTSQEQRERWYIIQLLYQLHKKINTLEKRLSTGDT